MTARTTGRWLIWTAAACGLAFLWWAVLHEPVQAQPAPAPVEAAADESRDVPPPTRDTAPETAATHGAADGGALTIEEQINYERRRRALVAGISIFVVSIFLGVELIGRIPATLHTPLMSGSNAISGITVVGALIAASSGLGFAPFLGFLAIILAMINVVGGFLVTHRMLMMFKRR